MANISKSFYRDFTSAKKEIRNKKYLQDQKMFSLFGIKKNGELYKKADSYQGREEFTIADAKKLKKQFEDLNPSKKWEIVEI